MSNYAFVASPFGHGFECIRTIEALCLGCIVIMKKSFLDYYIWGFTCVTCWWMGGDINETLLKYTLF